LYGKKSAIFDKTSKSIKFFNMFGEMIQTFRDIQHLDSLYFRPRPTDVLKKDQITRLKKDFKKKYEKQFKEEESEEKKIQADTVKE
jgi:hypothetical protein